MHDRKLKFGILGCGAAGVLHAMAIVRCAETDLVMVADHNEKAARNSRGIKADGTGQPKINLTTTIHIRFVPVRCWYIGCPVIFLRGKNYEQRNRTLQSI